MRIGVGSGNPVKRRAVEQALGLQAADETESAIASALGDEPHNDTDQMAVEAVPVSSGVSEQPVGHTETIAGARNRATAVINAGSYAYGVGIEGGVARVDGADDLFLIMWAVVSDGAQSGRGAGPSIALPEPLADRVDAGEELGPVMDDALGTTGIAKRGGAAGALTHGRVDRADALATAVAGAFGPFVSPLY